MDDMQSQQQQHLMPPTGCQIITNINGCKQYSVSATIKNIL